MASLSGALAAFIPSYQTSTAPPGNYSNYSPSGTIDAGKDAGILNSITNLTGMYGNVPTAENRSANSPAATQTQAADPYAAYGGTSAYNALKASIAAAHQGITSGVNDSVSNLGASYQNGVLGLIDQLNAGQHGIDQQSIQNELAKQQGVAGVTASVARGIKSGGVTLANRNAGSSSAAGALADAYGQQGRQQLSQVGNQYAQGQNSIQEAQNTFNTSVAGKQRDLEYNKQQQVNSIVNDAGTKLAQLDAQIAGASLPDRIAIDQEKQNIRNQALSALQQYDQQLSSAVGGLHPLDQASAITQARGLATAGTAPDNAFQFSESAPAQFAQGPVSSGLPLFTLKRNQQTA